MERSWNNSHRRIAKPQHSHHMPSLKFEPLPFTAVLKKCILENEGRGLPSSRCRNYHSTNPWLATQHLPLVNSMWASVNGILSGHDIRIHLDMRNALTCISIFWPCGNDTRTKESVIYKFPMYIIALLCLNIKKSIFHWGPSHFHIFESLARAWKGERGLVKQSFHR